MNHFHEIEVALEAAQSCIMGETPESMSDEQARERTLEMIREALLVHVPKVRREEKRMVDCLLVMQAAEGVGAGSLKTAAYDVVLNCVTPDVLKMRFAR